MLNIDCEQLLWMTCLIFCIRIIVCIESSVIFDFLEGRILSETATNTLKSVAVFAQYSRVSKHGAMF